MNLLSSLLKYTADQIAALRAKDTSQDTTVSGIDTRLTTAEGDIDSLEAQFTTVVSAVTTDTEVTNIRVGANGITYPTAGDAVRSMGTELIRYENDYAPVNFVTVSTGTVRHDYILKQGNTYIIKNNSTTNSVTIRNDVGGDTAEDFGSITKGLTQKIKPTVTGVLKTYSSGLVNISVECENNIYYQVNEHSNALDDIHDIVYVDENFTFVQGWVNTTTGKPSTSTTRCRSDKKLVMVGSTLHIYLPSNPFNIAKYDKQGNFLGLYQSSWRVDDSPLDVTFEDDTYVIVGVKKSDDSTIVPSDISGEACVSTNLKLYIDRKRSKQFYATYEAVEKPQTIESSISSRLSLIATKKDNSDDGRDPQDIGYLYVDEASDPQKMYYSANRWDRPVYLCDWKKAIVGDEDIKRWCPIITKDGDIIFLYQGKQNTRTNPVVYPHGDYNNPVRLNLSPSDGYLPSGLTTDTGACVSFSGDFVLWGEYNQSGQNSLEGYPMRIWKVSKPYVNASDWEIVCTQYYTTTSPTELTNKITHWHTVCYDRFSGNYYANTGDNDWCCKVFVSDDDGDNWTLVASNGQHLRTLGYVFTEDGAYWGTDSSRQSDHNLYFAPRDENGDIDFDSISIKGNCIDNGTTDGHTNLQRTYNSCLLRNPDGILLLDRAEERYDGLLNLEFYSFEDEQMHLVDVLHKLEDYTTRYGFGNYAVTQYQSTEEDGIICGSMNYDRIMSLDMLNNQTGNLLGVTKITVHRMNDIK